jgi:hypothetical protein
MNKEDFNVLTLPINNQLINNENINNENINNQLINNENINNQLINNENINNQLMNNEDINNQLMNNEDINILTLNNDKNVKCKKIKSKKLKKSIKTKTIKTITDIDISINIYKLNETPENIINYFTKNNYKINENKINGLNAYLISKGLYIKIFRDEDNTKNLINDIETFKAIYKKCIKIENYKNIGSNFCFILYNKYDKNNFEILFLKNNKLIKTTNNIFYNYIYKKIKKHNMFILTHNNKLTFSYGNYCSCFIDNKIIDNLFVDNSSIKKFYKYNKIKIIYWITTYIN